MSNIIHMIFGRGKKGRPARDVATLVVGLERTALHLVRARHPSRSYLGGDPRLPDGFTWPHRDGKKLRFLARLSLAELHAKEPTAWLPAAGSLLFFYDDEKQPWGFDPADRGSWAVLHVPDVEISALNEVSFSSQALPKSFVAHQRIKVLPSFERAEVEALKLSEQEFETYFDLAERRFEGLPKHQLLGLPSPAQGDSMEIECQLASHGIYCGTPEGFGSPQSKVLADGTKNWKLLLQIDSDEDLGWTWGDAGLLYFWVEESSAARADFSNVWMVLQCA